MNNIIPTIFLYLFLPALLWAEDTGRTDCIISSGNMDRHFIVYKPAGNLNRPSPVVFMFHGASGNGERFYNISGWKEKAESVGFIAVFPTAKRYCLRGDDGTRLVTRWNAGALEKEICESETLADDVLFFRDIVSYLKENYSVDCRRIYASGFSDGANFVSLLTIKAPDILAATAVVAGMLQDTTFQTKSPIPFFLAVGQKEILLAGPDGEALPLSPEVIEKHRLLMGIINRMVDRLGLEREYAVKENEHFLELVYSKSRMNVGNQLRFALIGNLGHNYPNGRNHPLVIADFFWEFFRDKVKSPVPTQVDISSGPFKSNVPDLCFQLPSKTLIPYN